MDWKSEIVEAAESLYNCSKDADWPRNHNRLTLTSYHNTLLLIARLSDDYPIDRILPEPDGVFLLEWRKGNNVFSARMLHDSIGYSVKTKNVYRGGSIPLDHENLRQCLWASLTEFYEIIKKENADEKKNV